MLSGAVRLDRIDGGQPRFAGLLLPGDLVGAELLALGAFGFSARTLVPSDIRHWSAAKTGGGADELMTSLVRIQQRTTELVTLRSGAAEERVSRLVLLLAGDQDGELVLPTLTDMAEVCDLAMESVSRAISRLRQFGALAARPRRHRFVLNREQLSAFHCLD